MANATIHVEETITLELTGDEARALRDHCGLYNANTGANARQIDRVHAALCAVVPNRVK